MRVEPENRSGTSGTRQAPEGPERDRVIPAEDERQMTAFHGPDDQVGDSFASLLDLRKETNALVPHGARLCDRCGDVAPVLTATPEVLDPRFQPGVADRRGTHVDTAAPRTEIESRADDRYAPRVFFFRHPGKASSADNDSPHGPRC